jgi:hypothetical protein
MSLWQRCNGCAPLCEVVYSMWQMSFLPLFHIMLLHVLEFATSGRPCAPAGCYESKNTIAGRKGELAWRNEGNSSSIARHPVPLCDIRNMSFLRDFWWFTESCNFSERRIDV